MKKILIYLLVFSFIFIPFNVFAEEDNINITKNAKATIMIEATTGEILYNKNANQRVSVASLTKMMSLILFLEFIEDGGMTYDEIITVSKNAKETGGTQLWLEEGEKISVEDLLKGVVMASANDVVVTKKQSPLIKEEITI